MIVSSYNQEFGYELLSSVLFAYQKHLTGELTETISGVGSEPLYYFSPKHTINTTKRDWANTLIARKHKDLPYTNIHTHERPSLKVPPYKEVYKNTEYKFEKPTLCICNRYNKEWGHAPINYFDDQVLEWLFTNLKSQYEIVYIAVDIPKDLEDNNLSMMLPDRGIAERHGVKIFQDIKGECWNTSLLKVFANCDHFITMNGGYSILASFFPGTNIVYSTKVGNYGCKEFEFKSFTRWYPNHNDQRTVFTDNYEGLKAKVKAIYVDNLPTANIIVRTSNRPNAFSHCIHSIQKQDYPNINIVVTTDEPKGVEYTRGVEVRHLDMSHISSGIRPKSNSNYGIPFKSNRYIAEAQNRINDGYILILDDDDMFAAENSVSTIMANVEENKLLVWRVDFKNKVIPSNETFGKKIVMCDIASNGFCYHVKHKDLTDWGEWKRADYRTAKKLSDSMPVKWLDAVLTKLQSNPGYGKRIDISPKNSYMKTVKVINPIIGKVGTLKRLTSQIAAKVVAQGYAEYISDVVDKLNGKAEVVGKPVVTENKQAVIELENKAQNGTQSNNNGNVPAENGSGKELSKANKPKGRPTNSGTNRSRNKKG